MADVPYCFDYWYNVKVSAAALSISVFFVAFTESLFSKLYELWFFCAEPKKVVLRISETCT